MPEPHLRAADADRTAVATVLGQHMTAGRLTVDEYDERLARAYAAKTYGELDQLTADLPATRPHPRASRPASAPPAQVGAPGSRGDAHSSWRAWLTTSLIVVTVWLATSLAAWELHYFWPIWVIGPWGAVLLAQTLTGSSRSGGDTTGEQHRKLGT
jgi:hypothetical protein